MRRSSPTLLLFALLLGAVPALAQRSSADAEVAFAYGVRAYNHGEWDEAVRRFREAVAASPDDATARSWLELALAQQGQAAPGGRAAAVPAFGGLLAVRDQPGFDLRLGATYGEDSNPARLPDNVVAVGPNFPPLFGEVDDKVADLDLRAAVYPFYGRGGGGPGSRWSLGLTGQVKAARFQDLDFLDERQWSAAFHLAWGSDPLGYLTGPMGYTRVPFGHSRVSFLLQAGRTDTRLDGDPLLTADEAALSAVCRESVTTATQVELDVQKRDLLDGGAKSDYWSAGASQLFFLSRRDRYLRLGFLRGEETDGLDGDVTSTAGTAELVLPLGDRMTLQLAGSRGKDEVDRATGSFDDTVTRAAGALTWQMARHLYLTGRASWTDRDSDLAPAAGSLDPLDYRDYRRTTASVGIQWLW